MSQLSKSEFQLDEDIIKSLENEIDLLEVELKGVELELNAFESQIRAQLHFQILRIRELTALYKNQKSVKKAKRLEQKKRGKNYKEPKEIKRTSSNKTSGNLLTSDDQQELKRLYKEAIVRVHPDKFVNDEEKTQRATDITSELNAIYERGDLDELSFFHEHIISGNAMTHISAQPETISDKNALFTFLQRKKQELTKVLEENKHSQIYEVLTTYNEPLTFINELRIQFEERITLLEKRTRKK